MALVNVDIELINILELKKIRSSLLMFISIKKR